MNPTSFQQAPQLFSLVLVICVLASLITFLMAGYRAIRGRRAGAITLLSRWAICAVAYLAVSVAVSVSRPPTTIEPGRNWCFDDWCIALEAVHQAPAPRSGDTIYTTDLRLYNDGRGAEGVHGFWAFLRDQDGRRFTPTDGPWRDVVAARIPGHGVVRVSMDFVVPAGARELGFVTGHGGPPCGLIMSLLEIGQGGCLFRGPNMIRVR